MRFGTDAILAILLVFFTANVVAMIGILLTKAISRRRWRLRQKLIPGLIRMLVDEPGSDALPWKRANFASDFARKAARSMFLETWLECTSGIEVPHAAHSAFREIVSDWDLATLIRRGISSPFQGRALASIRLLPLLEVSIRREVAMERFPRERRPLMALRLFATAVEACGTEELRSLARTTAIKGTGFLETLSRMVAGADSHASGQAGPEDESAAGDVYVDSAFVISQTRVQAELHQAQTNGTQAIEGVLSKYRRQLSDDPRLVHLFFRWYSETPDEIIRRQFASILSDRIGYFLSDPEWAVRPIVGRLLEDTVRSGNYAGLIMFLNSREADGNRNRIKDILEPMYGMHPGFLSYLQRYLSKKYRDEWKIPDLSQASIRSSSRIGARERMILITLLIITICSVPALYLLMHGRGIAWRYPSEILVDFLFFYHYTFAYYTIAINGIYFILMLLSWRYIIAQQREWRSTDQGFLFTAGVLPSVSILAPAYNEEKTITESINSLLSLQYPRFEVIVINDGSSDRTLETLVDEFSLVLTEQVTSPDIITAPVVGMYRSRTIPNLRVINKINGGKADSLNAGIVASRHEYICSIDADSMLEPESLLRIMVRSLATDAPLAACGGNIIPVNGCLTANGSLKKISLSKNIYARYQTIEYLRSFIAGRLGWAYLGSLLIISGAFGIFKREYIAAIGGYLTKRQNNKDTVGEDMEIVVRLSRYLHEQKKRHRIDYCHNANCWTEVPEDTVSLLKQRDRWHRGLIENLLFHRDVLFRPRYGKTGMVAFPYFFFFELLGPFFELLGYIVFLASFALGLLDSTVILFMFSIVVLFGLLISNSALFLSERGVVYFQGKDFIALVVRTIFENLGFRQWMSMHRTVAYAGYLYKNRGWQKLERRGFTPSTDRASTDRALTSKPFTGGQK